MIVLDANVLIAHLDSSDAHSTAATALLLELAAEPLAASAITLAEVLVGPARSGQTDRAVAALEQLGVSTVALTTDAPQRLAGLRASTQLRLPACCVLLAADSTRAALATFDRRLADVAAARGLTVHTGGR